MSSTGGGAFQNDTKRPDMTRVMGELPASLPLWMMQFYNAGAGAAENTTSRGAVA